jgi:cytoskeletal protein CcmA (bactofilin family)
LGAQISIINTGTTMIGEIHCKGLLIITGLVEGDIYSAKVVIKNKGHVKGDIHADSLVIEEGGLFDGRAHVPPGKATVAAHKGNSQTGEPDVA